jgi:hypothetical protein
MDMKARLRWWKEWAADLPSDLESKKCLKNCRGRASVLSEDGITATLCHGVVVQAVIGACPADFSWRGLARRVIFRVIRSRTARPPGRPGVGIGI